jgi:HPt (histidine-containing phosphotransfer) domain-containing protein
MPLPILDHEAIENLRALSPDDGDVFLKEILTIFIEDTPARITDLHNSRASVDIPSFVRAAHSIKGSASNVGASELRSIAEHLEHQARTSGLAKVEVDVAELEAAFVRVHAELKKLIDG